MMYSAYERERNIISKIMNIYLNYTVNPWVEYQLAFSPETPGIFRNQGLLLQKGVCER